MKVSNTTGVPQQVGILLNDGRKTSVRIMARRRLVQLPYGAIVDPRWLSLNKGTVAMLPEEGDYNPKQVAADAQAAKEKAEAAAAKATAPASSTDNA
jgi:hypothetical protein